MRKDERFDRGHDLIWERLVAAEPRLASLLGEVRAARPDDGDEFELYPERGSLRHSAFPWILVDLSDSPGFLFTF